MASASSCLAELHAAIVTAMRASASLLYIPVYDGTAPGVARHPYIVVGEWTEVGSDLLVRIGREATVTIHVWSALTSALQMETIAGAITDALDRRSLSMTNWDLLFSALDSVNTMLDTEELRHGIVRMRFKIAPKRGA